MPVTNSQANRVVIVSSLKGLSVSPRIEPGYIVFPSHKNNVLLLLDVLLPCEKGKEISSGAPGLGVMTHRKCRVDRLFPVT
jgi:hypothetical protein